MLKYIAPLVLAATIGFAEYKTDYKTGPISYVAVAGSLGVAAVEYNRNLRTLRK